jgi:hypothetical protein
MSPSTWSSTLPNATNTQTNNKNTHENLLKTTTATESETLRIESVESGTQTSIASSNLTLPTNQNPTISIPLSQSRRSSAFTPPHRESLCSVASSHEPLTLLASLCTAQSNSYWERERERERENILLTKMSNDVTPSTLFTHSFSFSHFTCSFSTNCKWRSLNWRIQLFQTTNSTHFYSSKNWSIKRRHNCGSWSTLRELVNRHIHRVHRGVVKRKLLSLPWFFLSIKLQILRQIFGGMGLFWRTSSILWNETNSKFCFVFFCCINEHIWMTDLFDFVPRHDGVCEFWYEFKWFQILYHLCHWWGTRDDRSHVFVL